MAVFDKLCETCWWQVCGYCFGFGRSPHLSRIGTDGNGEYTIVLNHRFPACPEPHVLDRVGCPQWKERESEEAK